MLCAKAIFGLVQLLATIFMHSQNGFLLFVSKAIIGAGAVRRNFLSARFPRICPRGRLCSVKQKIINLGIDNDSSIQQLLSIKLYIKVIQLS